eukprot:Opistho-2@21833
MLACLSAVRAYLRMGVPSSAPLLAPHVACASHASLPPARALWTTPACRSLQPFGRVAAHGKAKRAFLAEAAGKQLVVPPAEQLWVLGMAAVYASASRCVGRALGLVNLCIFSYHYWYNRGFNFHHWLHCMYIHRPYRKDVLPFAIRRSKNNKIPVYSRISQAGGRVRTKIQNVDGDIEALRALLVRDLSVHPEDVAVHLSSVEVRGLHTVSLKKYLTRLGF